MFLMSILLLKSWQVLFWKHIFFTFHFILWAVHMTIFLYRHLWRLVCRQQHMC